MDRGRFPAILERRTDPRSGFVYNSLFDLADYGDYKTWDYETMASEYNSFMRQFVKKDKPDYGNAGPSRVPTYSERIGKFTVEEFELPSCYGTGSEFVARNVSGDESSDSSDDDEITHGLSHHEKRLLTFEARLNRWNKRNHGHCGSIPSCEFHSCDESSSVASSYDDTWVTDDSADENTASVDPAFDRQRLQQRYNSANKGTDRNFRGCIDSFDTDASLMHRSRIDSESIYSTQNACKHLAQHHMRRKESIPIDIFRYQIVRIAHRVRIRELCRI